MLIIIAPVIESDRTAVSPYWCRTPLIITVEGGMICLCHKNKPQHSLTQQKKKYQDALICHTGMNLEGQKSVFISRKQKILDYLRD